jgi:hypothetical protein
MCSGLIEILNILLLIKEPPWRVAGELSIFYFTELFFKSPSIQSAIVPFNQKHSEFNVRLQISIAAKMLIVVSCRGNIKAASSGRKMKALRSSRSLGTTQAFKIARRHNRDHNPSEFKFPGCMSFTLCAPVCSRHVNKTVLTAESFDTFVIEVCQ